MRHALASLGCVLLILTVATMAQPGPTSRPAIKVGKDTTWISKPLKGDGTPDYIAALREQFGKGVTKDNNALVPLLEALGPELLQEAGREKTLKLLGVKLPATGVYLRRPGKSSPIKAQFDSALKRPWTPKEHPELAKWLKANAEPLAKLVAASKRSRFYAPPVVAKEGPIEVTVSLPLYGDVRNASQALIVRAYLAAGEGRMDALAPAYLKRVPVDFCSGKPFVYKLRGKGFVLYSVGINMRDDGGRGPDEGEDCDDFVIKTR